MCYTPNFVKHFATDLPEDNVKECLFTFRLKNVLNRSQKAITIKEKVDTLNIKIRDFC